MTGGPPLPDLAARRVRWFARALGEFLGSLDPEVHGDGWNLAFARAWVDDHMTEADMARAVGFEIGTSLYRPTPRSLLVTPSNGTTSGIVALFWAYLGSSAVDLLPSRSDTWTAGFARVLRDHDGDGAVRVLSKDAVDLDAFVPEHSAVIVYGTDATVARYRDLVTDARVPVLGYGSKTSFAVHDRDDWTDEDTDRYFRDLVAADGLGCLNPVVLYTPSVGGAVGRGLRALSDRVIAHYGDHPSAAAARHGFRADAVVSGHATATVGHFAVRPTGPFEAPPPTRGYGTAWVVEIDGPQDVAREWANVSGWVSSVTLSTAGPFARWSDVLAGLSPSRIADPGEAQRPPLAWSHDNGRNLLPLVRLTDVECAAAQR